MERQDTIKAGNMDRPAQTDGQHQLLLAELKRVGTQQEQLRQAVSEAAAEAASRGESFEISPLKSFKLGDSELAHLSMQLKDQLRTPAEAAVTSQAPEEESSSTCMSEAEQSTLPLAIAPAPKEAGSDSEAQMDLLVAELKRIQGQQEQLRAAVAQNRVLVVHPPKGFHADSVEDEYAEEKEVKPDPDRFIPSGGLTGFSVAKDLMKLDFSNPEEAPEEFRAVTFNAPRAKKGMRMPSLTALEIQTQGSFGIIEEKGLKMFLKRLQEDQQDMLDLIQEREKARKKGLQEPGLPTLKVPGPAVQWDVGQAPSPLVRRTGSPTVFESSRPQPQEGISDPAQSTSPGLSNNPTQRGPRGTGATPTRFATAAPAAAVAAALPISKLKASQESRAAPAVFTATPAAAQQAQHAQQPQHAQQAQQAQPGTSSQHPGDTQDTSAPATAPAQGGDEPTPLPQRAAFPRTPQTLAGVPESPTVHKSAESIVAKGPVKAASKAGAKGRGSDDREDVELTPEELGFAGHSDDAFAALRAKMEVAQGKKKKKDDKKEDKRKKADDTVGDGEVAAVPKGQLKTTLDADADKARQSRSDEKQDKERRKQEEKQRKQEVKQQQEAQEQQEKQRKRALKQQKELQDKQRRQESKNQEQQSRKGSKAEEEGEFEPEDDEEVQEAKGNSVFDAPVVNLAAGLQLGFTPSTAGKAKKKDK